jgi:integrase
MIPSFCCSTAHRGDERPVRAQQMSLPMSVPGLRPVAARDDASSETSIIPKTPFSRRLLSVRSRQAQSPMGQCELIFPNAAPRSEQLRQATAVPESSGLPPGLAAFSVSALPPATIAELIEQLRRHPTLAPRRLRDMISALRKICRLAGNRLELVPATATQIRTTFANFSPAAANISTARWCNLRSLALDALRHAGLPALQSRTREPLSLVWDALRDRLPDIESRAGLARFMSYCSGHQIDPPLVAEATFEDFLKALKAGSLVKSPTQVLRRAQQLWNRAVATIEGWPSIMVAVSESHHRYAFALTVFPDAFQADAAAFLTRKGNTDPFDKNYCPAVKPATTAMRRKQIAQMATALAKSGVPIEAITQLATLVEPSNAERLLRFLHDRRGGTFTYLHQQALLLKTIRRHWVRPPQADIDTIGPIAKNLAVKRCAMTPKNSRRLRQFDIDKNLSALLDLPDRVLAEVRRDDRGTQTDARRVMLALAVALLIATAMRIGNLAQLEPERHLVRVGRGGATVTLLVIPAEETKTRRSIEARLSPDVERLITTYQRDYLPKLAPDPCGALFLSRNGERCRPESLAVMINRFIKRETGLDVNAHLFRHFAAKLVLEHDPANIETVRQLLGHNSSTTTARAYSELRTAPAFKVYETIVSGRRESRSQGGPVIPSSGAAR